MFLYFTRGGQRMGLCGKEALLWAIQLHCRIVESTSAHRKRLPRYSGEGYGGRCAISDTDFKYYTQV